MVSFREMMCFWGPINGAPHLRVKSQKSPQKGVNRQFPVKSRKSLNFDLNQILYTDKNHQAHIVSGPAHAYSEFKMANGRHIENN